MTIWIQEAKFNPTIKTYILLGSIIYYSFKPHFLAMRLSMEYLPAPKINIVI